ncbi:MAG: hypothetical protein GY762_23455 [Proteobacteria bacterium]|nr:hypothetical protein [Pseudomonadota bacterium]
MLPYTEKDVCIGLDLLEKRFKEYANAHPENIDRIRTIAYEVARVQTEIRKHIDGITCRICPDCKASCCKMMPVDGWFTENDYFVYRVLHQAPFDIRAARETGEGCRFLGPEGCLLPLDTRPFPCVKVNCAALVEELEKSGDNEQVNKLLDEMDALQKQLWPLLK